MIEKKEKTRIRELNDLVTSAYNLCTKWIEGDEEIIPDNDLTIMVNALDKAMTQIELIAEMGSEGDVDLLKEKREKGSW